MTDTYKIGMARALVDYAGDLIHDLYIESDLDEDTKDELAKICEHTAEAINSLAELKRKVMQQNNKETSK